MSARKAPRLADKLVAAVPPEIGEPTDPQVLAALARALRAASKGLH